MDPVSLAVRVSVLMAQMYLKYERTKQLPTTVQEFLEYLKSISLLLQEVTEKQKENPKAVPDLAVAAINDLEKALKSGLAVLDECSSEVEEQASSTDESPPPRRVKWRAKLFQEETEHRLECSKKDILDAMSHLTLSEVICARQDIQQLLKDLDIHKDIVETMCKALQKDIQKIFLKMDRLPDQVVQSIQEKVIDNLKIDATKPQPQSLEPLQMVERLTSIDDFSSFYDSVVFQQSLRRLRVSKGCQEPERWAKEWAIRFREESEIDTALNQDRKLCLKLLYKLCDEWKDDSNTSVTDESIVAVFKATRVTNILNFCLVLDRAQCLYKMMYPGSATFGMHWVAKQHQEEDPAYWKPKLRKANGRTTMNKRYLWLLELPELELQKVEPIVRWLQPQCCHSLEEANPDKPDMHPRKPEPCPDSPTQPQPQDSQSPRQIDDCYSIDDFVRFYEHSTDFQESLKRLYKSMESREKPEASEAPVWKVSEAWAKAWAIRLRTEGQPVDEVLNMDRKLCLNLLYKLCNQWKDDTNTSVTDESIVSVFKARRIKNILGICLVLDRAHCLYKMKYPGLATFGMHWVAKQHVEESPEYWKPKLQTVGGEPTMNKRFLWLLAHPELGLHNSEAIVHWLQPQCCHNDLQEPLHHRRHNNMTPRKPDPCPDDQVRPHH